MAIDFSQIPKPAVIETLSFDEILQARKTRLLELMPTVADVINNESEPLNLLLQENAYRELILRQRINDSALAMMLAYASGQDLDAIGQDRYKLARLEITPADNTTNPVTHAVMESDDAYRIRLYLSTEALTTAGTRGQYKAIALAAAGDVADAAPFFISEGHVEIAVVSHANNGTASTETLTAVLAACNDDDARPMTDYVTVVQSPITPVEITANLELNTGIDAAGAQQALSAAQTGIDALLANRAIGEILAVSKIHALLHVAGVKRVILSAPTADVVPTATATVVVTSCTLTTSQGA